MWPIWLRCRLGLSAVSSSPALALPSPPGTTTPSAHSSNNHNRHEVGSGSTSHVLALACFARGDLDFLWARTKTPAEENTEIMLKFYKRFNSLFPPSHARV